MATTIRLARHGARKNPYYRIIVADSRAPRDGRRLEQIGIYDPTVNPEQVRFDTDKLARWLARGARPSQTVAELIKRSGAASQPVNTPAPAPDPGEAQA
jgi:small subunit ribosomal protein S16